VHVFRNRIEEANYSKRIPIEAIEQDHHWNLNLRRYIDNTPPPEPEDVQCHLNGGVPRAEVQTPEHVAQYAKFALDPNCVFTDLDDKTQRFIDGVGSTADVRRIIESQPGITATRDRLQDVLAKWWKTARDDFATLAPTEAAASKQLGDSRLPKVRATLLDQLVVALEPVEVLDSFQIRGVFVNWWDGTNEKSIKYDLKTITSIGWSPTLIPESLVIDRFFASERDVLATLNQEIGKAEAAVDEATEAAQTVLEYEPDEDEKVTTAFVRALLAETIDEEKNEDTDVLVQAANVLNEAEAHLKAVKIERDRLNDELTLKVELKLFGPEDKIEPLSALLNQAKSELAAAGDALTKFGQPIDKRPKLTVYEKDLLRKRKALAADVATLEDKLAAIDLLFKQIGGMITTDQARDLILQKHHDLVSGHLDRYRQAEELTLFALFETLFSKYAISLAKLDNKRARMLTEINGFIAKLGYG
jgi:type I restriction enzyme M protein